MLNTVYDVDYDACICEEGYSANIHGFCMKVIPINCESGYYLDLNEGCLRCP